MITKEQLKQIMIYASQANIEKFHGPLVDTMATYFIDTPVRMAMFLAQLAHESGCLKYVQEIADGKAYEGRKDLGNVLSGDGVRFKGRGLIQITGRANYTHLSKDFGVDFIANPWLIEQPQYAALTAGWFWNKNNLNQWCDKNDFKTLTKRINGGYNGLADREKYLERAKKVFSL